MNPYYIYEENVLMWNSYEKRPILQYLLLAFLIAWGATTIVMIGERLEWFTGPIGTVVYYLVAGLTVGFAPAYAIAILLKKSGQIHGIKDLWGRIVRTNHISGSQALIIAVFFAIQIVVNILCNQYLGQPWYMILLLFPFMIIGGGMEELGWRGFLQPALEQKLPFFVATLFTGVIWAIWHLPLWLLQNAGQSSMKFLSFLCWIIAMSFLLAVIYRLTGSVIICVCFHAWFNALGGLFTMDLLTQPLHAKSIVLLGLQIILAMIVYSRMNFSRKKLDK